MNNEKTLNRLSILLEGSKGVIAFGDVAAHTDAKKGGPAALEVETGFLLYSLIKRYKLKNIVETGTHFGYSAAWFASALADNYEMDSHLGRGAVYTIDVDAYDGKGTKLWRRMVLQLFIKSYRAESHKFDLSVLPKIDMLFLDSQHTTEYVLKEFRHFQPMLADFCVIALHDTTLVPELQEAVKEVKRLISPPPKKVECVSTFIDSLDEWMDHHREIDHIKFPSMRGLDILIVQKG